MYKAFTMNNLNLYRWSFYPFSLAILFMVLPFSGFSQKERVTLFDQLTYDDVLKVEIQTDLKTLFEDNRFEEEYQDANFLYKNADGDEELFDMKLRLRGRFRRKNCAIPPVKLNFDKDDLEARGWKKDDQLKLVTPCVTGPEGREYIMREYLAYKIYQLLHPVHYRVQLIKLTMVDPETRDKFKGWGFIIEDDEMLANRWEMERCQECYGVDLEQFDMSSLEATAIFQYLVANSDWSVTLNKNIELLYQVDEQQQDTTYFVVPYDFDYTGFVNPGYAVPNSDYNLTSVRDRIYLCPVESPHPENGIQLLLEKKQAIIDLIKDFKRLPYDSRNDLIEFVESCYTTLAEEGLKRPDNLIGN
jgi:hypothetical protein